MLKRFGEDKKMRVSTGPIALARPGWSLKPKAVTTIVSENAHGRPDVLAAQMLLGAAVSGVKVLVLLPWDRSDDPVWSVVTSLTGSTPEAAARAISALPLVMYSKGVGSKYASRAELVYAPGLSPADLRELSAMTDAPVLTFSDMDAEVASRTSAEVIRVSGDTILLDSEGVEIPVVLDADGPVYRPA